VILGGRTHSPAVDFGESGKIVAHGGGDGFVVKLAPN